MLVELSQTVFGLKFESQGHNKLIHFASIPYAEIAAFLTDTRIIGDLPKEGPAIVIADHKHGTEAIIMHWVVMRKAGRTIRFFAKRKVANPDARETEFAKSRRTQHDLFTFGDVADEQESAIKKISKIIGRWFIPWYAKAFNPYFADPKDPKSLDNRRAFRDAIRDLQNGHLVGMFPQGGRNPDGLDLLSILTGAAGLAKISGAPIYPVGLNGTEKFFNRLKIIRIGTPFTYQDRVLTS